MQGNAQSICGRPSTPSWHIQTISLGLFLVLEAYSADVPKSGQKHYTVKGLIEPALKLEQTSDCMSVVLVCVSAVCTYMCASASRQKWCCCRLPESGAPLSPADSKMLKRDAHIHTHKHTCASVEITQECPQISLFNKLGAFYIQEGEGVKKCQSTDIYLFFFFLSGHE